MLRLIIKEEMFSNDVVYEARQSIKNCRFLNKKESLCFKIEN